MTADTNWRMNGIGAEIPWPNPRTDGHPMAGGPRIQICAALGCTVADPGGGPAGCCRCGPGKGRWAARRGPCGRCRAGTARAGCGRRTDGGVAAVVRQCGLCLDWGLSRLWYGLRWSCHGWLENRGDGAVSEVLPGRGRGRWRTVPAVRNRGAGGAPGRHRGRLPGADPAARLRAGSGAAGCTEPTVPPQAGSSPAPSSTRPSQAQRPDVNERRQALRPPCNREQAAAPNGRPAAVPAAPPRSSVRMRIPRLRLLDRSLVRRRTGSPSHRPMRQTGSRGVPSARSLRGDAPLIPLTCRRPLACSGSCT
ncbi:UNVERIFIED_CONTAM: hypothetical protein RKD50_008984 [Streptomyces canus]